jgi:hypothetical protein
MEFYIRTALRGSKGFFVRLVALMIGAAGLGCISAPAQSVSNQELARLLASEGSRESGIAKVLEAPDSKLSVLLSWTQAPPAGVNKSDLYVGLADAFARLRAKAAIPFLIKNISLQRWLSTPNIWLKTAQVVQERLPAASALIQIGPEASKAIIHTSWVRMAPDDRLAAIFVVSRIKGVPEAPAFLSSVLGQANLERHWADEGLKALNTDSQPLR